MKKSPPIKAAILTQVKKPLVIKNVYSNKLKKGQVLVKIFFSGICRSQLMECNGQRGKDKWLPHLLGHEASGEIVNIGKGVSKFKIKDRVILTWIKCDGINASPAKYQYRDKVINAGKVTTFSNYSVVSEDRLIKIPDYLDYKTALLYGCAIPTGAGIVINQVKPKKKDSVIVVGLGGIGLSACLMLYAKGVKNLIAIDVNKKKLSFAKKLGFKTFLYDQKNLKQKIHRLTNGGSDYCIEAAGRTKTIEFAFSLINNNGKLFFASHPPDNEKIKIDPHELIKGKSIYGSWGGCHKNPDRDIKKIMSIFHNANINLHHLISKEYKIEQINIAMREMKNSDVFRPVIKMEHS